MKEPIICPVCKQTLEFGEKTAFCKNGHSFDRSREGSVNLIINGSPSAGDDPLMAAARKRFLGAGYYSHLLSALKDSVRTSVFDGCTVIDACCGEGYFTNGLQNEFPESQFYGFDLSKRALRYAARDSQKALFFSANISSVPVKDGAADILFHIFYLNQVTLYHPGYKDAYNKLKKKEDTKEEKDFYDVFEAVCEFLTIKIPEKG